MRKNLSKVVEAFKLGKAAQGDSKRTIWTDGHNVYSYSMLIAKRFTDNSNKVMFVVIDRSYGPSKTTKMQIDGIRNALEPNVSIVSKDSCLTWDFKFSSSY